MLAEPHAPAHLRSTSTAGVVLRPYQEQAVAAAIAELSGAERASVVMACGTGKTLVAQQIAAALVGAGGRVLVLVPSMTLLEQTYRQWTSVWPGIVCAGFYSGSMDTGDEDLDPCQVEVPTVTTEPAVLAAWDARHAGRTRVVFGTYHSSRVLAQVHQGTDLVWDLVVADEAHRTAGVVDDRHAGAAARAFSTVLDADLIRARRRLFMTATPRVQAIDQDDDRSIASMDDEDLYGRFVYTYTLPEAIADGWLADYVVVVAAITDPAVEDLVRRSIPISLGRGRRVASAQVAQAAAVLRVARDHDIRRAVAFHNRVDHAAAFAHILTAVARQLDAGRQVVAHLAHGGQDEAQRRAVLESLHAGTVDALHVVTNVRVLAEGVDVPTLDAVIFAEPRTSPIEVTQIVGRAVRRSPERDRPSVIVLPVIVGPGDDVDERLAATDFTAVVQTIRALSEHDSRILPALAWSSHAPGASRSSPLRVVVYGDVLDVADETTPVDDLTWASAISSLVISRSGASWYASAGGIAAFRTEQHRWPSKAAADPRERFLGARLGQLRRQADAGTLSAFQRAWLDEHAPGWNLTRDQRWLARGVELLAHLETRAGTFPRHDATDPGERNLRRWWDEVLRDARKRTLPAHRLAWVNEHFPEWNTDPWYATARHVIAYQREHGRWPSAVSADPATARWGRWLSNLRHQVRAERPPATSPRAQRTERLHAERVAWMDEHAPAGWRGTSRRNR